MDYNKLTVPIKVETAADFIAKNKDDYFNALTTIRDIVEWTIKGERIIKVYGRDEKQGGQFTKDVRKIALKFNDKYKGKKAGSLWKVQDIVGFTIVVSYPSDICRICELLDAGIEKKILTSAIGKSLKGDDRKKSSIKINPLYGKVLADNGYFGVHYNLKKHSYGNSPICEVQIKTAVHDAWGAKTHDLTYKAPVPFDPKLVESFQLLGDMLAKLDHQSDVLRETLENTVRVRSTKQKAINNHIVKEMFSASIGVLSCNKGVRRKLGKEISNITTFTPKMVLSQLEATIIDCANPNSTNYSLSEFAPYIAHYVLGKNANSPEIIRSAEDGLVLWTDRMKDPFDKVFGLANVGLFKYLNGDWFQAVEETTRAMDLYDTLDPPTKDATEVERFYRRGNSICISLAYYYAERIGTDEGNKLNVLKEANYFLDRSLQFRKFLSTCPSNVFVDDEVILASVDDSAGEKDQGKSNFNCLDCELFVRIQIADSVEEVEKLRSILHVLHKNPPASLSAAGLYFSFHDYCARQRLHELE